jgi:hypothetical protein
LAATVASTWRVRLSMFAWTSLILAAASAFSCVHFARPLSAASQGLLGQTHAASGELLGPLVRFLTALTSPTSSIRRSLSSPLRGRAPNRAMAASRSGVPPWV